MTDDEVLNQTRHWLEKAVIGLNLCPFAKAVYVKNQVRLVVSHARHADDLLEELDRELDLLVATPAEEIDTTLLILPDMLGREDCRRLRVLLRYGTPAPRLRTNGVAADRPSSQARASISAALSTLGWFPSKWR